MPFLKKNKQELYQALLARARQHTREELNDGTAHAHLRNTAEQHAAPNLTPTDARACIAKALRVARGDHVKENA